MSVIIRLQNLPWAANFADIRRYFSGLSIPEGGVHIVGGEKGDAFIAFGTDEDARQAMERDGGKVKDMKVKLLLSSRTEMARVIDQARNQNLTLQAPAVAVKAAVSDSDRRKIRERSPSPRRREREKSPVRDRERRRSVKKDRSRSRSRSPSRRNKDRDSDRRSERPRRDERHVDDSHDRYKNRDYNQRESAQDRRKYPTADKDSMVGRQMPPNSSKPFDPQIGSTPQTYGFRSMEQPDVHFPARRDELPQSRNATYSDPQNMLPNTASFQYLPSMNTTRQFNEPLQPPFSGGFQPHFEQRIPTGPTVNYEAKRPSPTPATSAPNVGSSIPYAKEHGIPDPYGGNISHDYGGYPASTYSNVQTAERGAVPAVPNDRRVFHSNQPVYGAEPHARYDQIPEANQAGRSTNASAPREMAGHESGGYGKMTSNMPPVTTPSNMQGGRPVRRSRFEPEPENNQSASATGVDRRSHDSFTNQMDIHTRSSSMDNFPQSRDRPGMANEAPWHSNQQRQTQTWGQSSQSHFSQHSNQDVVPMDIEDNLAQTPPSMRAYQPPDNRRQEHGFSQDNRMNTREPFNYRSDQSRDTGFENMREPLFNDNRVDMTNANRNDMSNLNRSDMSHLNRNDMSNLNRNDMSSLNRNDMSNLNRNDMSNLNRNDMSNLNRNDIPNLNRNQLHTASRNQISTSNRHDMLRTNRNEMSNTMSGSNRNQISSTIPGSNRNPMSNANRNELPGTNRNQLPNPTLSDMSGRNEILSGNRNEMPGVNRMPHGNRSDMSNTSRNNLSGSTVNRNELTGTNRNAVPDINRSELPSGSRAETSSVIKNETSTAGRSQTSGSSRNDTSSRGNQSTPDPTVTVEIRGLASDTSERDILDLFRGIFIPNNNVKLLKNHFGKSTGYAYVKFIYARDREDALKRNRGRIGNTRIQISACPLSVYDNAGNEQKFPDRKQMDQNSPIPYGAIHNSPKSIDPNVTTAKGTQSPRKNTGPPPYVEQKISSKTDEKISNRNPARASNQKVSVPTKPPTQPEKKNSDIDSRKVSNQPIPKTSLTTGSSDQLRESPLPPKKVSLPVKRPNESDSGKISQSAAPAKIADQSSPKKTDVPPKQSMDTIPPRQNIEKMPTQRSKQEHAIHKSNLKPCEEDLCLQIKGLPYTCNDEEIIHFFDGLCILDVFIETSDGQATGVGFIEFATPADFHAALDMTGKRIGHRYIDISVASKEMMSVARGERRKPPLIPHAPSTQTRRAAPESTSFCVVINKLPKHISSHDIADFFSEINLVPRAIHIMLNPNQSPTGEAFAEFATVRDMETSLQRDGFIFDGSRISVVPVSYQEMCDVLGTPPSLLPPSTPLLKSPRESDQPPPRRALLPTMEDDMPHFDHPESRSGGRFTRMRGMQPRSDGGRPPRPFRHGGPPAPPQRSGPPFHPRHPGSQMRFPSGPRNGHGPGDFGMPGCVVAIDNLHYRAGLEDILEYFCMYNLNKNSVIRKYNENGQPTAEARVAFNCPEDAHHAVMELHGKPLMGRPINLSLI